MFFHREWARCLLRRCGLASFLCAVLQVFPCTGQSAAEKAKEPERTERSRLLVYQAPGGQERRVETAAEWAVRRRQILQGMEAVMGPLPAWPRLSPPEMRVTQLVERNGVKQLTITYRAEDRDPVPAILLAPKHRQGNRRFPAMLALHQTVAIGKGEPAGLGGSANLHYGLELAQRGYVVLVPDYPSFGDYKYDFRKSRFVSGSMKGIFNHMRGVDLLQSLDDVDRQRIGVIGHSLGAHNSMFVGAFDERLKVIVASCGWTPFHDYYGGKIEGWTSDRYMPRLRNVYGLDPNRVPFDFYEVVAALAPRAFFSNSPVKDDNFAVAGVKKVEPKAREVFALLGAASELQIRYPDSAHDFPPAVRREAYAFIDRVLQHTPTQPVP